MTGSVIQGYHNCRALSTGLYSQLFTAIRDSDGLPVILKMPKSYSPTREEDEAIRHEANILEILKNSPSTPRFYGEEQRGKSSFIVMEKIESPSVSSLLSQKKKFDLEEFLAFALAAVAALENIHRFDVIHRDINDQNVLYDPDKKECKIVDFSLSLAINHQKVIPVSPEFLEGTLPYISPEQSGRMNRGIDYRTDYYSLGVLFYRTLTGELPFFSEDPLSLVYMHIAILPLPPVKWDPAIPEAVSDIILKLLSKEPEGRYQSIAGIRGDLTDCLNGLKEGKIVPFSLGSHDTYERFQIPEKIYGRQEELDRLMAQYESVVEGGSGFVLIGGYPGAGKTALVHEMYKPISDKHGGIITGKFEQFKHNIPYFALTAAFKEYIKWMLTESDEKLELFRERLLGALGQHGQLLIDILPSLEKVIGKQPPLPKVGIEETQNRFAYFIQRFIQCLPTADRPLTLFLDDLQWADPPSLRMLHSLLYIECPYLLIVGGYRNNEVNENHPLTHMLRELDKEGFSYEHFFINPLKFNDIQDLIADSLFRSREEVTPLAEICLAKTAGNPFFLIQLLESLYTSDAIRYDWSSVRWVWDIEKIQSAHFSDNVIDLMIEKIRSLEPDQQSLLTSAACIGNRFSMETLVAVRGQSREKLRPTIEALLKKEFLICKEKHYYSAQNFQFAHDRIQQAAHELTDKERRIHLHASIGEHLLTTTPAEKIKEVIFTIVDHYNEVIEEEEAPPSWFMDKKKIGALNITAAKAAKEAAAYEVALKYCHYSLKWLDGEDWQNEYDFLIDLYSEAIECAYLSGKFDLVEQYGEIVASQSKDIFDELRAIKIRGLYHVYKGEIAAIVTLFLDTAERLGIHIPNNPGILQVLIELSKVFITKAMTGRSIEQLAELPPMDNRSAAAYMDLINEFGPSLYISGKINIYSLVIFKALQLIFQYGNSGKTTFLYATFGIILIDLGAIESGYRYGKLALLVADQFDDPKARTATTFPALCMVLHWKEELQQVCALLMQNYQSAIEAGNLQFAAYSLSTGLGYFIYTGTPLTELLEKIDTYEKILLQLKNKHANDRLTLIRQAIMKLAYPHSYNVAESEFLNPTNSGFMHVLQLMTSWILRDFEKAQTAIEAFKQYEGAMKGLYHLPIFFFYKALTLTALLEKSPLKKRSTMRRSIKQEIARFKKYAKHGPVNHLHKYLLLQAEWARVNGKALQAQHLYERAIASAAKEKFIQEQAIANELTCRFYLGEKMPEFAILFLKEALQCYEKWGARSKQEMLADEFLELLESPKEKKISGTAKEKQKVTEYTLKIGSAAIDTETIRKSTETIASTILIDELLKKLMGIAMEHAGAEKGLLLVAKGEDFFIEAESDKRSGETRLLRSAMIRPESLPLNVLQYVIREKSALLLKEASRDVHFRENSYIQKGSVKSILCLPLLNQERITAVLYLENNLTKNAFTDERCGLLNFLSSQLAMSIDNAKLYDGLKLLNLSYERFVPKDFLSLLGKTHITEVAPGDHKQKNMSILFLDIRDFTTLSEKMNPTENFVFINEFLGCMEPIIRANNGFIDKYIGDAIMALFSESADDALLCAIEMVKKLEQYNIQREERKEPPIRIGIGINSGPLILGTVGNEKRMDGTVISDAVNVASRVEHLTKKYERSILITENARQQLKDPNRYLLRPLAETEIRGKKEKITLYGLEDAEWRDR